MYITYEYIEAIFPLIIAMNIIDPGTSSPFMFFVKDSAERLFFFISCLANNTEKYWMILLIIIGNYTQTFILTLLV